MYERFVMPNNPKPPLWRQTILPTLSLLTSVGTLVCCALPALLVTLGMGATLAGLIGVAPWITALSEYKTLIFIVAGVLIVLAALLQWRARNAPCPVDPLKAKACRQLRKASWITLGIATFFYMVGVFFAFVAVYIFF